MKPSNPFAREANPFAPTNNSFSTRGLLGANVEDVKLKAALAERERVKNLGELAMKNTNTPFYDKMLVETADRLGRGLLGTKSPEEAYLEAFNKRAQEASKAFAGKDLTTPQGMLQAASALHELGYTKEAIDLVKQAEDFQNGGKGISTFGQTMNDIAKMYGLDLTKPADRETAMEIAERYKRQDPSVVAALRDASTRLKIALETGKELAGEESENIGHFAKEIYTDAKKATADLGRYDMMLSILDRIDTGALTEWETEGKNIANQLFNADFNIAGEETFRSLAMQETLTYVNQTKGSISDKEMELFAAASPSLARSKAGNKLLIEFAKSGAERKKALAKEYARWRKELRDDGVRPTQDMWELHVDEWKNKQTPFLTQEKIDEALGKTQNNVEQPKPKNKTVKFSDL